MSHTRQQQDSSSSNILQRLNVTPMTATSDDFQEKLGDAEKNLLAEVCKELNIEKDNNDLAALKQMVTDYLIEYLNNKNNYSREATIPDRVKIEASGAVVITAYINYKIQQQVSSISRDKDNPLKNESYPNEIILNNIKKIVRYLEEKTTSSEFNNEILSQIFKDELPSIIYILNHCPLIVKNEKGNYDFIAKSIFYRLVAHVAFDELPPVSEEDKALIIALSTPSW